MSPTTEPAGLLPREFFGRPSQQVAAALLGCVLSRRTEAGTVSVLLTETEAYAGEVDPASHAYRGRTARNAVMFGPPGHAYVYFTYGMHFCVNLVCLGEGTASAVLLRAGAVIEGEALALGRRTGGRRSGAGFADEPRPGAPSAGEPRPGAPPGGAGRGRAMPARDLARGPARLCQALGIDRSLDGADVCDPGSPLRISGHPEGRAAPPSAENRRVSTGPRVGVSSGADVPWRFWLDGEPTVSAYRPYARRIAKRLPIVAPGVARCNA